MPTWMKMESESLYRDESSTSVSRPILKNTGDPQSLALTFDDGPNPEVTPQLLRLLARYNVNVTFFLVGSFVRANASLVREIVSAGHSVGNHTQSHVNLMRSSAQTIRRELDMCSEEIAAACGVRPRFMRPPYGLRRPGLKQIAVSIGLEWLVMWSRHAWDWNPQDHSTLIQRMQTIRGGDIVLLHDGCVQPFHTIGRTSTIVEEDGVLLQHNLPEAVADQSHTVLALAEQIPRWFDQGYRFVTIDQLCH